MAYEKINERIRVMADFKNGRIIPYFFEWCGKRYKIQKVNLVHYRKEGATKINIFSVSTPEGLFLISYNPSEHTWFLEELNPD